ncbi:hypothetical protein AVEN_60041-1 [Araneus ventricosus]|uniref:Uncharacterized protein n=1 Tax=Araneus ventricosus TaxID=182803 RepID=A0A4Y2UP04_ARAVE|nr:hypothetical protein AVEN_60041-1 [Araneus ventricosus]
MPGDEVIGNPFQPFLFEVWRWLPHMPRHCVNTLCGIVKCRTNSTTTAIIAVRQVKPFEAGRERYILREEDNILSNSLSQRVQPSARRRHWGNAALPGSFSGARIDGSRLVQDRDYRWDGQTLPSGAAAAVVFCTPPHAVSVVVEQFPSSYHLFSA